MKLPRPTITIGRGRGSRATSGGKFTALRHVAPSQCPIVSLCRQRVGVRARRIARAAERALNARVEITERYAQQRASRSALTSRVGATGSRA